MTTKNQGSSNFSLYFTTYCKIKS